MGKRAFLQGVAFALLAVFLLAVAMGAQQTPALNSTHNLTAQLPANSPTTASRATTVPPTTTQVIIESEPNLAGAAGTFQVYDQLLLTVTAIVAFITAASYPAYRSVKRQQKISSYRRAMERYLKKQGLEPPPLDLPPKEEAAAKPESRSPPPPAPPAPKS